VEVTTRCNAACVYCPRTAYRDAWHDRSLSPAAFRRLLPALKKTRLVHLQGWGEPFLHPDFFTLTALAKEAGCRVSTTTNGMLLNEDKLRQVVASNLDLIAFSLTGLAEHNDRARPSTSFRQVLAAIQTLNRLKAAAGRATPEIHLAYLLLKSGLPDLEKLPQLLEGLGVQQAVISTLDFVPTRELAGESFPAGDPAAQEELQARLAVMAAAADRVGVQVHYPLKPPGVRGLLCPENPLRALCVAADGAVSPCVFTNLPVSRATYLGLGGEQPYQPLIFGNLLEQDLGAIWRRPAYAHFRRTFFTGRLATPCRHCLKL
jgi:MoaA/NifB/PqqE/SkfB family radical SAM enzyme